VCPGLPPHFRLHVALLHTGARLKLLGPYASLLVALCAPPDLGGPRPAFLLSAPGNKVVRVSNKGSIEGYRAPNHDAPGRSVLVRKLRFVDTTSTATTVGSGRISDDGTEIVRCARATRDGLRVLHTGARLQLLDPHSSLFVALCAPFVRLNTSRNWEFLHNIICMS
jgi:hypothetical protein